MESPGAFFGQKRIDSPFLYYVSYLDTLIPRNEGNEVVFTNIKKFA